MMSHDDTHLRIALGRVLERWQMQLLSRETVAAKHACRESLALDHFCEVTSMLATHINQIKQCITPASAEPSLDESELAAEAEHAARLARMPPADRINATIEWLQSRER